MSRPHLYLVPLNGPTETTHAVDEHPCRRGLDGQPNSQSESSKRQRIKATRVPRDWQLSLPFEDAPSGPTILIVTMDGMNGEVFRGLIRERRPSSAIDLREMIRFDLPGSSREDVFRTLQAASTHYVKDPLPWHRLDAHAWAALEGPLSNTLVHEIAERDAHCVLVLVYRHAEARAIASHLTKVLSERMQGPWHIEEAS